MITWLTPLVSPVSGSLLRAACSLSEKFSHIFCCFLGTFGRMADIPVTLSIDLFLFVVAMYSLKKQVYLASRGYSGLHFANYTPLV